MPEGVRAGKKSNTCEKGLKHTTRKRDRKVGEDKTYAVFHRIQRGGILMNSASLAEFTSHRGCVLSADIMRGSF